jgi:sigma-B regulation protein RsbU (phosphoserine phosphatase)
LSIERAAGQTGAAGPENDFEKAPCGYLVTDLKGTITKVNRSFEAMTGLGREDLLGKKRFQQLLNRPGQLYYETHFFPLLRMQGSVEEIALEITREGGSPLPVLVNAAIDDSVAGVECVRMMIFGARERRHYEEALLRGRRDEHEIAQRLQQSLLAGDLPGDSRVKVVSHYQSAIRGLEVGGDWYDAFWLDRDRVGMVVGDVVGRGIEAAAAMGQLRSAIRALASTGLRPTAVLEALDRFAERHRIGAFATVAYAEVNLAEMELRLACAGHLPPVLSVPESEPLLLWEGRSAPLTVKRSGGREEAVRTLAPKSRLLLYTDGLVERRGEIIDKGLDRLLAAVYGHHGSLDDLARDLVRRLEAAQSDDVCVLAASFDS